MSGLMVFQCSLGVSIIVLIHFSQNLFLMHNINSVRLHRNGLNTFYLANIRFIVS